MRRVLIVTYPYFPSYHVGVRRVAQLCRYLPENGWEPVILTKQWSDPPLPEDEFFGRTRSLDVENEIGYLPTTILAPYVRRDNAALRLHRRLVAAGSRGPLPMRVARVATRKLLSAFQSRFGEWPDRYVGWVAEATRVGTRTVRALGIAAIVSVCPPHTDHLVGGGIARRTGLPWVPMFDDLGGFYIGPGDHYSTFSRAAARHANKRSLRGARLITANTPHMLDYLRREYGAEGEALVPGYTPMPETTPPRGNALRISLTGSIYMAEQYPQLFFDALDLLFERDPTAIHQVEATLLGTRVEAELRAMLAGRRCEPAVRLIERLPVAAALLMQQSSHLLLVLNSCGPQTKIGTMSFPSKMYEYLGAKRPILALPADPGGWGEEVLAITGAGSSASTAEDAAAAIAQALEEWRAKGRLAYGGIDAAIERFSVPNQTRVLAGMLDRLTRSSTAPARLEPAAQ